MLMEVSEANLLQIRMSDLNVPDLTFRFLERMKLYSANKIYKGLNKSRPIWYNGHLMKSETMVLELQNKK